MTVPLKTESSISFEKLSTHPERIKRMRDRAYTFWKQRGQPIGSPEEDWYKAEREEQQLNPIGRGKHCWIQGDFLYSRTRRFTALYEFSSAPTEEPCHNCKGGNAFRYEVRVYKVEEQLTNGDTLPAEECYWIMALNLIMDDGFNRGLAWCQKPDCVKAYQQTSLWSFMA